MKYRGKKRILPSEKLVMNILNSTPGAEEDVLSFYEHYIQEMATDPVYAADGSRSGYFYDEDLLRSGTKVGALSEPSCGS